MKISTQVVQEVLQKLNVEYKWNVIPGEFELASLFNPVPCGFYFFSGLETVPSSITDSIVMVSSSIKSGESAGNQYIYLKEADPQQVYYQVVNYLFSRKSTGAIAATALVSPKSMLGKNVQVDDFCIIEENCKIGDNVIIGSHSKIHAGTHIGDNTIIESASIIGTQGVAWTWNEDQSLKIVQPQLGGVIIGSNCFLAANSIIVRGSLNEHTAIGDNTLIAPGCRIGHGTKIGHSVHFANSVVTGGNTNIGAFCFVGSAAVFRPKVQVHSKTVVGAGSLVIKNTSTEGKTLMGVPAKEMETKEKPSGMPAPKR